jgi:hypothetical protein
LCQLFLLGMYIFWDTISWTICLGLVSNCNPPDLYLLSSYNYRYEPLVPSKDLFLLNNMLKCYNSPMKFYESRREAGLFR